MKRTIRLLSIVFIIFSGKSAAIEWVLLDFETNTTGNVTTRWPADSIRWLPDPTGRSTGVLGVYLNSSYVQPDGYEKGYLFLHNQQVMGATGLKLDLWVPADFPYLPACPWFVLFAQRGGEWVQHSAEGIYMAEGWPGGWATETWITLTMDFALANDEGPGTISDWVSPLTWLGLFMDWLQELTYDGEIYIDNIRLDGVGHPLFTPKPAEPTNISVADSIPGQNVITWTDWQHEESASDSLVFERYNIYVSESPITDITAESVHRVAGGIPQNVETWTHKLFSTEISETMSYYYAVTSRDGFREYSPELTNPLPDTNATISPAVNTTTAISPIYYLDRSITVDGNLDEYADLRPIDLGQSGDVWVLLTDDSLFVAADIKDNSFNPGDPYPYELTGDHFNLYLGLYDYELTPARYYLGNDAYRISFSSYTHPFTGWDIFCPSFHSENGEAVRIVTDGVGYTLEFSVPLSDFYVDFTPVAGMTLPIDIEIIGTNGGTLTIANRGARTQAAGLKLATCLWAHTEIYDAPLEPLSIQDEGSSPVIGHDFMLTPTFPNPFNNSVTITYDLSQKYKVDLSVIDIRGAEIINLYSGTQIQGIHSIQWDGLNSHGEEMGSGLYFVKIQVDGKIQIQKMSLLK